MKKLRLTKKAKVGILVGLASILLIALIIILLSIERPKTYDVENLKPLIFNSSNFCDVNGSYSSN